MKKTNITRKAKIKPSLEDGFIRVDVQRMNARTGRVVSPKPSERIQKASYFLLVDIQAKTETVYVPVSVGSGRVSTGFVYLLEGTAKGKAKATIKVGGEGIVMVSSGSLLYAKIEAGKRASFTIEFEITSTSREEYKVTLSRINYKLNTNDTRYKRFPVEIDTKTVSFK